MKVIELSEYSTSDDVLGVGQAAEIAAASGGALTLADASSSGARLAARQYVGVVVTPQVEVRIHPKIPAANVLGMLTASTGLVSWLPSSAEIGQQDDLMRSTVAFFAREVADLLAAGPQREYVVEEELLAAPRGRLNTAAMARRGGLPSPVPCRFDDYTPDTLLHRYLVAAMRHSLRVPDLERPVQRLLRHARAAVADARDVPVAADAIDRHHFTRLDQRYRPAVALGRLILERLSLYFGEGGHEARSFTVDMNQLFEAWVAKRLPAYLQEGLRLEAQTSRHLDENRTLRIKPDIELVRGRRAVYVADTKYKLTETGLGRITDYYQAHAYATVLKLPEAMLIYCDDGGQTPERRLDITGSGISVLTHAMPLSGTHEALERGLEKLAELMLARTHELAAAG